jgi:flavin-dependent dehydrogenase
MTQRSILGAGLAGLSCAVSLSQYGERVLVSDKNSVVGGKCATSIRVIKNYEGPDVLKKLSSIKINTSKPNPIYRIVKYSPNGKHYSVISNEEPLYYSFKRGSSSDSLDSAIYNQAAYSGVDFRFSTTGPIEDYDVIAIGSNNYNSFGVGRHYLDISFDQHTIYFFLDNYYAPKGYFCLMPYFSEATLLTVAFEKESFLYLPKRLEEISKIPIITDLLEGATIENNHSGGCHFSLPKTAVKNGKYLIGESAGFVEAARGFGQYYGLLSGHLAAKAIAEVLDYDSLWKSEFYSELESSIKRRRILDSLSNDDYNRIVAAEDKEINAKKYTQKKKQAQ